MVNSLDRSQNAVDTSVTSEEVTGILGKYRINISPEKVSENIDEISARVAKLIKESREEIVVDAVRSVILGK